LALKDDNLFEAALYFRLVTTFDPQNDKAHNNLAWSIVKVPDANALPKDWALDSARKAVELKPENWMYWNTLGVTAFRSNDWKSAAAALGKSISLNEGGGGAIDFLVLAMTLWHQGKTEDAQKYFKQGADKYLKNNPGDRELYQFHREAMHLIKPAGPTSKPKPAQANTNEDATETAQKKQLSASERDGPICFQSRSQRLFVKRIIFG
jgi:tetratricopeptide (TPR) repeat protein